MAGGGAKVTVEEVRKAQRASGPATVLAIGTATPANCVYQADYPDYYFKITKSEHLADLKEKFKRMCECIYMLHLPFLACCCSRPSIHPTQLSATALAPSSCVLGLASVLPPVGTRK
jgi:hypothetical protein